MTFDTISVVGLGYIGLPTAAAFASCKVKVIGVDVNQQTVNIINQGKIHIVEPGLDVAVKQAITDGWLRASIIPESADAFLIAVPTPFKDGYEPDLGYIEAACKSVASVLKPGDLVVLESTSPVGTTELVVDWMVKVRPDLTFPAEHGEDSDIRVAYCPERVLPGQIMRELVENDRLIGGLTEKCALSAIDLYKLFVKGECVITNARTAEMAKLTENSFRDVNIAFANELSMICDKLNINVWELVELSNRHPRVNVLSPGPGVGGHCIAVDPWFIVSKTPSDARLIKTAREINNRKPVWVIEKVQVAVSEFLQRNPNKTSKELIIACYGISFKPDIDDLRESPALDITKKLADLHSGLLLVIEPNIKKLPKELEFKNVTLCDSVVARVKADIHVLLVGHSEFRKLEEPIGITLDFNGIWKGAERC